MKEVAMTRSIVEDLRRGREGIGILPAAGVELTVLRARARAIKVSPRRRDEALRALLRRYRTGNQRLWAPLILDLMAPAIVSRLQRFKAVPPVITEEDIAQQLVLQVLVSAATMPLSEDARYLERSLGMAAAKRVSRWLARESRRQDGQLNLEEVDNGRP
jgi:hypothetical protein